MGLFPWDFYRMTWADYSRSAQGYWIRNARNLEGTRKIMFAIAKTSGDPKKVRHLREDQLFRVITDPPKKNTEPVKLSAAERKALLNRYYKQN